MKIGLLAYHSACNMGATLQLLSTYNYLQNAGHTPIVINWVAEDLEKMYNTCVPSAQKDMQIQLRHTLWNETCECKTSKDVVSIIEKERIQSVIIGSDAVAQHHPILERLHLDKSKLIKIDPITSDRNFPNPFWGDFNHFLSAPVPVAILSASSQDSCYRLIPYHTIKKMKQAILNYRYFSVRDSWTQDMISYITQHEIIPHITPDPVFAFNYSAGYLIPSKQEILEKFGLPDSYFLFSLLTKDILSQEWLSTFEKKAKERGIACVSLPFAHRASWGFLDYSIEMPLSPLDWYGLIKYSCGYIGNNMHPIIVSIHNHVPFYSFDNYGIRRLHNYITSDKSSKILHILTIAGLSAYRTSVINRKKVLPSSDEVLHQLSHFPIEKEKAFANQWQQTYINTMQQLLSKLKSE